MLILWVVLSTLTVVSIMISEKNNCQIGTILASALTTILIERVWQAGQDIFNTTNWQTSQTKLKRGGFIKDNTIIRISFSYLYRIKVENKYLLIQNSRNTGKYQPVGGVYKFQGNERQELKNLFHIMDDDKIPIDESSHNDYRLRIENRYLRKFVSRFNSKKAERERIDNTGREFREELVKTGILNWDRISYRYCGRYITDLKFEEHFQIYEMLLIDVIELLPTPDQENDLKNLMGQDKGLCCFATADQITCLGTNVNNKNLNEWIGDHTKITLQENETKLMKMPGVGKTYEVLLDVENHNS